MSPAVRLRYRACKCGSDKFHRESHVAGTGLAIGVCHASAAVSESLANRCGATFTTGSALVKERLSSLFAFLAQISLATPSLIQPIFQVAQKHRKPNVEHHRQTDDLMAGLEVAERGALGYEVRLAGCLDRLKKSPSDNAVLRVRLHRAGRKGLFSRQVP